ncbi:nucleoside-diphosphate kinase [Candidatus Lariskella endosymbiont of Epinotia ramella]|uniref:nucleoside-diphosphate kinase n=1 Tax=Candidatus Lariskella endosymbiont of Epinotia ramella TaxID=3066224 RepID=UPI0030D5D8FE
MIEQTLSIIKPDAIRKNLRSAINQRFLDVGLEIVAAKELHMTQKQAEDFYAVHKERPFFGELVEYMTSGPVVVQVLSGPGAVEKNRHVMGATDPSQAEPGTIRRDFGESIGINAVHGSDSKENAMQEIRFFFGDIV